MTAPPHGVLATRRRRRSRAAIVLVSVLAIVLASAGLEGASAVAAPPASDTTDPRVEQAREIFRLGTALSDRGQWSDALAQFERSAVLRPHAVTIYNLAFCERALGRFTRAKRAFRAALAAPEGELPPNLAMQARGYLAEMESRLSRALVIVPTPDARIAIDGRPLELASAGDADAEAVAGTRGPGAGERVPARSFQLVLDPGTHVIVVSTPGAPDLVVTRTFDAGSTVPLALGTAAPAPPPANGLSSRRQGAVTSFVFGGVGVVGAAVFGGLAMSKVATLQSVCAGTPCPATLQPTIDTMRLYANASTIGTVLAGVGAAAGAILWATGAPAPQGSPRTVAISLAPATLEVRARF
jgi:hypothetical protein